MKPDYERLEQDLEREYANLGDLLNTNRPADPLIARIQQAVTQEARLYLRKRKWRIATRTALSTAAAALLLLFFAWPESSPTSPVDLVDAGSFVEWVAALDETDSRMTTLLETDWLTAAPGRDGENGSMEGVIESLDESLDSFESIIGI